MKPHGYVDTFIIDEVKQERIPETVYGFEHMQPIIRSLLEKCPVILGEFNGEEDLRLPFGYAQDEYPVHRIELMQPTPSHRRSFVIKGEGFDDEWQDEHGHVYRTVTIKGNNFSHSELIETATASERFIAYGLQESAVIERVLKGSRLLRQAGIGTEYIIGLAEPQEFHIREFGLPVKDKPVDLVNYKHYLTEYHWRHLPEDQRTAESYVETAKRQDSSTYYISMRAMDTPYRLGDLYRSPEARKETLELVNKQRAEEGKQQYNPEYEPDLVRFVGEVVAPKLADNLVELRRKLGLVHYYPNELNISALGSLVDLDSLRGEKLQLGDDPNTASDYAKDMLEVLLAFRPMISFRPRATDNELAMELPSTIFVREYVERMLDTEDTEEAMKQLIEMRLAMPALLADKENSDRWGSLSHIAMHWFEEQLGNYILKERNVVDAILEDWVKNRAKILQPQIHDQIVETLQEGLTQLGEDCLWAYGNDFLSANVDPFEVIMGRSKRVVDSSAYAKLWADAQSLVRAQFVEFVRENPKQFTRYPELFKDANDETWGILQSCIFDSKSACGFIDEWTNNVVYQDLEQCEELVRKSYSPKHGDYVLTEKFVTTTCASTADNYMAVETHLVPLFEIAKHLEEYWDEELIIETPDVYEDQPAFAAYKVSDDAEIIQYISDCMSLGQFADTEYDDDGRITCWNYILTASAYTLFVEQKHAGGRRYRLMLHDKDQKFVDGLDGLSRHEALDKVTNAYSSQGQLFDPGVLRPKWISMILVGIDD